MRRDDDFGGDLELGVDGRRELHREARGLGGGDLAPGQIGEGRVTEIYNNYLDVQPIDAGGNDVGPVIRVLKPQPLRHTATIDGATLSTTDAQTVTASKSGESETWVVTPPYAAGIRIAYRTGAPQSSEDDAAEAITSRYVDLNEAARYWYWENA
ncbi:MAG: hypothetical protein AAF612_12105 [Planctomycetota bacterium]